MKVKVPQSDRTVPIAWLPTPVKLTPDGGPIVVGIAEDTLLAKAELQHWQQQAAQRGEHDLQGQQG